MIYEAHVSHDGKAICWATFTTKQDAENYIAKMADRLLSKGIDYSFRVTSQLRRD